MAKNLLIDTCIWRELISPIEYSGYLRQLTIWVERSEVNLYCPEVLKEEWTKHRLESMGKIEKVLKSHVGNLKRAKLFDKEPDFDEFDLEPAEKYLQSQIFEVDRLFAQAFLIEENDKDVLLARKQKKENKAPFKTKPASENDAVLIFSTLAELTSRGEDELYFFSTNATDFGDPKNPQTQLHEDITGCFPEIKVQYFASLSEGIKQLIGIGLASGKSLMVTQKKVTKVIAVNKNLSVQQQLFQYLEKRFIDITFLPKKLFVNHYPFLLAEHPFAWHQPFSVFTDNKELLAWFEQLPVENGRYSTDDIEVNGILKLLLANLIHFVGTEKKHFDQFAIPMPLQGECGCGLCLYKDYRFSEVMTKMKDLDTEEPALKRAYLHYKMGQYQKALGVLLEFSKEALEKKHYISFFIAQFNIVQLGKLIKYDHDDTAQELALIEMAESIDLEDHFTKYANRENREILLWIKDLQFVTGIRKRLQKLLDQIRDLYHSQSSGWNYHTRELQNEFYEAVCFLEYNFIIFDRFSEVRELARIMIEGLFASYGCHTMLGGKLTQFGDYVLEKAILYANSKDIIEMHQRYKLKQLNYGSGEGESLLVKNFVVLLKDYQATAEGFLSFDSESRLAFWSSYRRVFTNFMTFISIVDLAQEDFNNLFGELMAFMKIQRHFNETEFTRTLKYFISHKSNRFNRSQLEELLFFSLTTDSINEHSLIDLIGQIMQEEKHTVVFPKAVWSEVQNKLLTNEYLKDSYSAIDTLGVLFTLCTSLTKKAEISRFVKHLLKYQYSADTFYTAIMYDIIGFNKKLHLSYLSDINKIVDKGKGVTVFNRKEFYNNGRIDAFVNYMIKFDLPIDAEWILYIMQLDPYYQWLFDMEHFDYAGFNPDWLFNHLTRYYKAKFQKSVALRNFLDKHCRTSVNIRLLQLYVDLYAGARIDAD